ncbi:MAG TPA: hypothetical protein VFC99_04535 [Acidimicrobiia bacterium]|nr:hypothetical protein [Acidimicrobiia bacterium]
MSEVPVPTDRDRARNDATCDLSTICMICGTPMAEEHAHYRCPACGWRDSCCM